MCPDHETNIVFPIQTTYMMFSREFPFFLFINLHTHARHQIMMESGVRHSRRWKKTLPVFTLKGLLDGGREPQVGAVTCLIG